MLSDGSLFSRRQLRPQTQQRLFRRNLTRNTPLATNSCVYPTTSRINNLRNNYTEGEAQHLWDRPQGVVGLNHSISAPALTRLRELEPVPTTQRVIMPGYDNRRSTEILRPYSRPSSKLRRRPISQAGLPVLSPNVELYLYPSLSGTPHMTTRKRKNVLSSDRQYRPNFSGQVKKNHLKSKRRIRCPESVNNEHVFKHWTCVVGRPRV